MQCNKFPLILGFRLLLYLRTNCTRHVITPRGVGRGGGGGRWRGWGRGGGGGGWGWVGGGWGGGGGGKVCQVFRKKRYVTLEWPLSVDLEPSAALMEVKRHVDSRYRQRQKRWRNSRTSASPRVVLPGRGGGGTTEWGGGGGGGGGGGVG